VTGFAVRLLVLIVQNFAPLLGHGIFTSDGDAWYWQGKLAAHIFTAKR